MSTFVDQLPDHHLLGLCVKAMTLEDLNHAIDEAIRLGERWFIATHNQHSLYLYHREAGFRALFSRARFAYIDGMSLILLGRLLGMPLHRKHRITWVDWVRPFMRAADTNGWRIFYMGGRPGVAERGAAILRREFPSLVIKTAHGFFDQAPESAENQERIRQINAFKADVLMVGLGMPRQEKWIAANLDQLDVHVMLPTGACMSYVAGEVATPPRWMGRAGLEWLFRLWSEPRRMWRRYLIEPWYLFFLLLPELVRLRILRQR